MRPRSLYKWLERTTAEFVQIVRGDVTRFVELQHGGEKKYEAGLNPFCFERQQRAEAVICVCRHLVTVSGTMSALFMPIAVLSAVYQTHQAVRKPDSTDAKESEKDVLKMWTILGIFIPLQFYLEAIASVLPFANLILFVPNIAFPLFYIWLSAPTLKAAPYLFERFQPVVAEQILPFLHTKLLNVFCFLQRFFLGNFLTVIPRKDLEELQSSMTSARSAMLAPRRD